MFTCNLLLSYGTMPLYFSMREDIMLFREAIAQGWANFEAVASNVGVAIGKPMPKRTAKERLERLLKQYKAEDTANLQNNAVVFLHERGYYASP